MVKRFQNRLVVTTLLTLLFSGCSADFTELMDKLNALQEVNDKLTQANTYLKKQVSELESLKKQLEEKDARIDLLTQEKAKAEQDLRKLRDMTSLH